MSALELPPGAVEALRSRIEAAIGRSGRREIRLMEVCGTHTMAIFASGLRSLLPPGVRLVSGPGCPVCVTPPEYLDRAIATAKTHGAALATFGDMMRVPASGGTSLERERAGGLDVLAVYSPLDALRYARERPGRKVVFLAVGFETTAPAVAGAVLRARREGLTNFFLLAGHKLIPPAMEAVLAGGARLDGFICPGHVSVIIGARAYERIARGRGVPCVVAGFEPADILLAVAMLAEQIADGRSEVEIEYRRCVTREGNRTAQETMAAVFEVADADWRGLGTIPASGLELRDEFGELDAARVLPAEVRPSRANPGCRCGEVLAGRLEPPECPLFARACSPATPVGPCMVSSEGSCAAHFKYGRQ